MRSKAEAATEAEARRSKRASEGRSRWWKGPSAIRIRIRIRIRLSADSKSRYKYLAK